MTTNPLNFPAFARPYSEDGMDYYNAEEGMSLRDYFAGQALVGLSTHFGLGYSPEYFAELSYKQADALLAERAK